MNVRFHQEYSFDIADCKIDTILTVFINLQKLILTDLIRVTILAFANAMMAGKFKKSFCCDKCGNSESFTWKTRNGKPTSIVTVFCKISIPQLQVKCSCCSQRLFITRQLLGMRKFERIPESTSKKFALVGALSSFRVSEKIGRLFGWSLSKMTIWRCVQRVGESIKFDLDPNELPCGEADGTGIPIQHIKKRGRELKVFVQKKVCGGVQVASLGIGKYDGGWKKVFKPIMNTLKCFEHFLLVVDGDEGIKKGFGKNVKVIFQRCLWHIPHQIKHYLWKDDVKRKSDEWYSVHSKILDICSLPQRPEDEKEAEKIIRQKEKALDKLISHCRASGYKSCTSHLENARNDMFTAFRKKLNGKTTSLVERVMRTVNLRINVGKWTEKGALNVNKVRLAHYYNGFNPIAEPKSVQIKKEV